MSGTDAGRGWPGHWWTAALVSVLLAGVAVYDAGWVVRILGGPAVDWWQLLGPAVGGLWLAMLAAQTGHRATTLFRTSRAGGAEPSAVGAEAPVAD